MSDSESKSVRYTVTRNFEFLEHILQQYKCLILCDIDETLIKFKSLHSKWWGETFEKHYKSCNSYNFAEEYTYMDWMDIVHSEKATHTDPEGFKRVLELLQVQDSKLIFLTARNSDMSLRTIGHLNESGITKIGDSELNESHFVFCGEKPKGECIRDSIDLSGYSKIIFIDDLLLNLENVWEIYTDKIELYKFEYTES